MLIDEIRERLGRRAIVLELDDSGPPEHPGASWFGRVNLGEPGERWPRSNGRPMLPLCQINLWDMPFRPPRLDDVAFLTVFVDATDLPLDTPNGEGWCLRAYRDAGSLVPLEAPGGSRLVPFPLRPRVIERDFPKHEDVPVELLPEPVDKRYYDLFETAEGLKLGGWPTLIQAEIFWAPWNQHPADPEYVFQIDSTDKGNWWWGDQGVGYFGRGTAAGTTDEWTLSWQCY